MGEDCDAHLCVCVFRYICVCVCVCFYGMGIHSSSCMWVCVISLGISAFISPKHETWSCEICKTYVTTKKTLQLILTKKNLNIKKLYIYILCILCLINPTCLSIIIIFKDDQANTCKYNQTEPHCAILRCKFVPMWNVLVRAWQETQSDVLCLFPALIIAPWILSGRNLNLNEFQDYATRRSMTSQSALRSKATRPSPFDCRVPRCTIINAFKDEQNMWCKFNHFMCNSPSC